MRGPALTHSGPVHNIRQRVSLPQQLSVDLVSTNIYYFNNTWTEPRGLVNNNDRACWVLVGSSTNACATPPTGAFTFTYDNDSRLFAPTTRTEWSSRTFTTPTTT